MGCGSLKNFCNASVYDSMILAEASIASAFVISCAWISFRSRSVFVLETWSAIPPCTRQALALSTHFFLSCSCAEIEVSMTEIGTCLHFALSFSSKVPFTSGRNSLGRSVY